MTGNLDMGANQINLDTTKGFVNSGPWTRNTTPHGYIDIGPANSSYAHIYTDRPSFYFNKAIRVNGVILTSNSGTVTSVAAASGTGISVSGSPITTSGTLTITNTAPNIVQTTVSGNAGSATVLANARTIAGVSFDGSSNISLNNNAITNGAGYLKKTTDTFTGNLTLTGNINTSGNTITGALTVNNAGTSPNPGSPTSPNFPIASNTGNPGIYLSEPDQWLVVNINGQDYVIPAYLP